MNTSFDSIRALLQQTPEQERSAVRSQIASAATFGLLTNGALALGAGAMAVRGFKKGATLSPILFGLVALWSLTGVSRNLWVRSNVSEGHLGCSVYLRVPGQQKVTMRI